MTEKKVILVTGGTGLVGNGIRLALEEENKIKENRKNNEDWIFVNSKDADLCNFTQTKEMFDKYKPTHVIHVAGLFGGLYFLQKNKVDVLRKNIIMTDNILEISHITGVNHVISILSTCIFPDNTAYPVDESMIFNGPPHPSVAAYCYSKRMAIVQSKLYCEERGRMYTGVIPCGIFGPYDNFNLQSSNVIPGVIRKMYDAKMRGDDSYSVYGSGKALRQFMYSLDFGKLLIWALRNYKDTEPIIIATNEEEEVSIAEAVKVIKDAVGFNGSLMFDTTKSDGQIKKTASNKKLRTLNPNFKFTKFEDAIKSTVDWYALNVRTARN